MKQKAIILISCLLLCLLAPGVSANVLSITPASAQHQTGETQSYDVVLDSAPQGLSGFNITIAIENFAVGEITGVSFPAWASPKSNGTVPSASVWCKATDLANQSGMQNIILCTLTVRAVGTGTTNINLVSVKVEDTVGGKYDPSVVLSVLTVGGDAHIATIGVFRDGSFYLKDATAFGYGLTGDTPIAGDWTGTGVDTGGVFRNGSFYLRDATSFAYGLTGDKPVAGDWNGDRTTEVGVFRDGVFYLRDSTGGTEGFAYGLAGDLPIAGDWNGDRTTEVGVFRDGVFYLRDSTGGTEGFAYGLTGDSPIAGDWDGDGKTEVGVFRDGSFYLRAQDGSTYSAFGYGLTGDTPIAGTWI